MFIFSNIFAPQSPGKLVSQNCFWVSQTLKWVKRFFLVRFKIIYAWPFPSDDYFFYLYKNPRFLPPQNHLTFGPKIWTFLKKNCIINGDFVIYLVFPILQGYFIIWNFYRLFRNINCLENLIVICIKKVVRKSAELL